MALGVSEEHLELAVSVRGWAERHCGPDVVRAAAESDGTQSPEPDSALLGLHLPEESGGQGYGPAGAYGGGQSAGAHWARQVLLTRALTIGGGTTNIQLNITGERMLGLPRDPEPPAG